jgi:hypothetical protein
VQPPKQIPIGVGHDLIVFDRHGLASAALRTVEARREIFQGNETEASVVPLNLVEGQRAAGGWPGRGYQVIPTLRSPRRIASPAEFGRLLGGIAESVLPYLAACGRP